ncbi:MAG: ABC transporter ATP-binding protein [Candidatus Odinarchaeota archaeon]
MAGQDTVLEVKDLSLIFKTYKGIVRALDKITFNIYKGEVLGIVGETGCGKSVTAKCIVRLIESPPGKITEGAIQFDNRDLLKISEEAIRRVRGREITMIFQDPMTFLNPVLTIGTQVEEVIMIHQDLTENANYYKKRHYQEMLEETDNEKKKAKLKERIEELDKAENPRHLSRREKKAIARVKAIDILKLVRMPYPEKILKTYPHELSGGMRQRVMIAMALSCNPKVLIADEATTSLDVTIQAQILSLLNDLKNKIGASIVIITHDLGIVAETCDRFIVMYAGVVVEEGKTEEVFRNPLHPYTHGLLQAIPKLHEEQKDLTVIRGNVPDLIYPPSGCRFHPRCPNAQDICEKEKPPHEEKENGHLVSCFFPMTN